MDRDTIKITPTRSVIGNMLENMRLENMRKSDRRNYKMISNKKPESIYWDDTGHWITPKHREPVKVTHITHDDEKFLILLNEADPYTEAVMLILDETQSIWLGRVEAHSIIIKRLNLDELISECLDWDEALTKGTILDSFRL